jgi:hypothetical protein
VGIEPTITASERTKTVLALDGTATVTGIYEYVLVYICPESSGAQLGPSNRKIITEYSLPSFYKNATAGKVARFSQIC